MMIPISVLPTYAPPRTFNRFPSSRLMRGPYRTVWPRSGSGIAPQPLPLNVYATGDFVRIVAAVPGVAPEHLDITIDQNLLTLRGETYPPAAEGSETTWYVREVWAGRFQRTVALPFEVNTDHAEASFEHGLLTITLPKAEHAKPQKIEVHVSQTPRELAAGAPQASEA
jgi:HSP20 family protein